MSIFHQDHKEETKQPVHKEPISEEELLKKAFHIGRTSPANCECPPAPDIIPVWINNNVEIFESYIDRLFSEYDIPRESLPKVLLAIFEGFKDLIQANPDEGQSGGFSRKKDIEISQNIFVRIAEKRGIRLDLPLHSA